MEKTTLLRYFTISMILLFVIEIFFIGIQSGGQQEPSPTPSPTTAPAEVFEGTAIAEAEVAGLGDELLVRCNATGSADAVRGVDGVSGVSEDPANALMDVSLYRGADALDVSRSLQDLLGGSCELSVLRFSFLSFNDTVQFTSSADNRSRSVPARAINCFSDRTGRCFALVNPATKQGEKIGVSMFLRLVDDRIERLLVQQQDTPVSSFKQVSAKGRVVSLSSAATAFSEVNWEDRNLNRSEIEAALYPASVTEFNYFPDSSIVLPTLDNETVQQLQNLSFVKLVSPRDGNTLLFVEDNFTDAQAVISALRGAGVNATPEFAASRFSVSFDASNATNFSSLKPALEASLNSSVELRRQAEVDLQDVAFLETQLGASFGNNTAASVFVETSMQLNSSIDLQLSVYVMLGEVSSFAASPAAPEAEPTPSLEELPSPEENVSPTAIPAAAHSNSS